VFTGAGHVDSGCSLQPPIVVCSRGSSMELREDQARPRAPGAE
jgi:hypothetical protein